MRNIFNILFKSCLLLMPLLCLLLSFLLWNIPYRAFSDFILNYLSKQELRLYWERDLMPFERYALLPYCTLFFFLLSLVFSYFFWERGYGIFDYFLSFTKWIKQKNLDFLCDFKAQDKHTRGGVILLFVFVLLRSVYNICAYEIQYDEAWTYINFIDKGVIVAGLSPHNNHILYTLFAAVLDYFPLSGKWVLRLPVLFFALISAYLYLDYWRKYSSWRRALYATFIFVSIAPFMIYAMYGRAYMLSFAFEILLLIAMDRVYLRTNAQRSYYITLLVLAQVLGIYALVTFLYWALPLQIIVLFFTRDYKTWLKINLLSMAILFILYLPFLWTNGMNILWAAAESTASNYTYAEHWGLFHKLSDWMLFGADIPYLGYITLVFGIFCFWIGWRDKEKILKFWGLCAGTLLFLPLLIFFYQPMRVWSIQILAYAFFLSYIVFKIKFQRSWQYSLSQKIFILLLIGQQYALYRHYEINWAKDLDKQAKELAGLLLQHNVGEIYTFSRYDKPLLEYYYTVKKKPLNIIMPYRESKNYKPFGAKTYQAVILDREDYVPTRMDSLILAEKKYQSIYKNERIEVYLSPEF